MKYIPAPKMVEQLCAWCGDRFKANKVDVQRGSWLGKYCSKSCRALHQSHKANSHSRHVIYKRKKEAMSTQLEEDENEE